MTDRDRRTIFIGSAVLGSVLAVWFVLAPWWQSWNDTRAHIEHSRAQLADFQDRARRLTSMDRQLETVLGPAVKSPLHGMASTRRQLVKAVSDLYAQNGAEIQSVQVQTERPISELPGVTRLAVQVQCAAQPLQLIKLMSSAKTSALPLLLDQVEMNSASRGGGGGSSVTMVWSVLAAQNGADRE